MKSIKRYQKYLLPILFAFAIILSFSAAKVFAANRANAQRCQGTCIAIYESKAVPNTLAVVNGTYVQFNSADGKSHELGLGEGGTEHHHLGTFESGVFGAGEAYRMKFTKDGAYYFHDHLNPKINILIVVYTPGKDYSIKP